jgi:hypothetical protein
VCSETWRSQTEQLSMEQNCWEKNRATSQPQPLRLKWCRTALARIVHCITRRLFNCTGFTSNCVSTRTGLQTKGIDFAGPHVINKSSSVYLAAPTTTQQSVGACSFRLSAHYLKVRHSLIGPSKLQFMDHVLVQLLHCSTRSPRGQNTRSHSD